MQYESAISLKSSLLRDTVSNSIVASSALPRAARNVTDSPRVARRPRFPFALGVTGKDNQYRLAIRIQRALPGINGAIEEVRRRARGECDVQVVGPVVKQLPWYQKRNRPLRIGGSCGHPSITAGTLGCFVTDRVTGEPLILSNNHVLAAENNATIGDPIIQPAPSDGGNVNVDTVAALHSFVRLRSRNNKVDAATALIDYDVDYFFNWLEDRGEISGIRETPLEEDEIVYKIGRTTGYTRGRISATDIDELLVDFDVGVLEFNGQIQVRPADDEPFSLGGDSGSLVVDRYNRAVGLLFAGNDVDSTFINPISTVLDTLRVDLQF